MKKLKIEMRINYLYFPDEAKFFAMDKDGKWLWYKKMPTRISNEWLPCKQEEGEFEEEDRLVCQCNPLSKDEWKDSLIEI